MNQPAIPETTVLPAVGHCIYCGSTEGNLTNEHIIPRGLNGTLLLPKSTCKTHQDLTSAIESEIQASDGMLYNPRLLLGMRSYKKLKDRPTEVKMTFIRADETTFKKKVPIKLASSVLALPYFIAPVAITGTLPLSRKNSIDVSGSNQSSIGAPLEAFVIKMGARGIKGNVRIPMGAFVRYLCKIAYGFHVVEQGEFDRTESPALALLLEERSDMGNWVGCVQDDLDDAAKKMGNDWHRLEMVKLTLSNGTECDAVAISLFNFLIPCTYLVITRCPGYQDMVES